MVMVLTGALNGNIIVLRIPITLTGYQTVRDDINFKDCTIIYYETALEMAH